MARGRQRWSDPRWILTFGDRVPQSVGGILLAMAAASIAVWTTPSAWSWLALSGPRIFRGEVWRLVTWVFPQGDALSLIFAGFVLHWLGRDLAHVWSERRFLQVFLGYAAWAAAWTAVVGLFWAGAEQPHIGAWPVVNALLVGWALSRPGAQINLFGIVPMTAQVFAWLLVGGTVLFALSARGGVGEYLPHLAALALAFLLDRGLSPRRLWLRLKQRWYEARLRRRRGHLRPVDRDRDGGPRWMN